MALRRDPQLLALRLVQVFVGLVLALALFVALVVPYHATDALVYGQLSRAIGDQGGFLVDWVNYPAYSRPLFYVPQGWLWWAVGWQEWLGRLWSLAFFVLLLWALFRLACDRSLPRITPWLALLVLLASPDAVTQAIGGQTDIPVAALIATAAVLLWRRPPAARTAVLIALAVAGAVLAKSTSLPALVGLALACFIGDRAGLRDRLRFGLLPIVAGTVLALVYGVVMARHFGLSLDSFLGGEVGGPQAPPTATASLSLPAGLGDPVATSAPVQRVINGLTDFFSSNRDSILLRAEWLGPYLRLLVQFGLVYAIVRVTGLRHRPSAIVAFVLAVLGYVLGPKLLTGGDLAFDDSVGSIALTILALVPLAAVAWCPPEQVVGRALLGRLLLLGLLPLLAWGVFGIIGDTRTLSPSWPAMFLLCAIPLAMGVAGLATRSAVVAALAVVVIALMGVLDLRNFDGLGVRPDGSVNATRALRELTPDTWLDPNAARVAADPQLGGMVDAVRASLPPDGRLASNDGRMIYYAPNRADVGAAPSSCAVLGDADVLALILNGAEPFDPTSLDCLEPVSVVPGSYGVWRVTR
jgi:4-amino-4-deoxy-L-arabinose transferase-like glycosyltransferase